MSTFKFSAQQQAIIEKAMQFVSNICINANAGTGKTFTIVQLCIAIARKLGFRKFDMLFLAFNRSIADELKGKSIGDGKTLSNIADVANTHSFGLRCLNFALRGAGIRISRENNNIDKDKYKKIIKKMVSPDYDGNVSEVVSTASDLFDLCRINLLKAGDMNAMQGLIHHHSLKVNAEIIRIVNELMKTAYDFDWSNPVVNCTDMLVYPLSFHYRNPNANIIPAYKLVFIDECQDLSRAQREIMKVAARRGRFVAVGDPNQAINGFAGANNDSFDLIAKLPNTITLPLSVNYRCGKSIISLAQEIVPAIQAHDGAEEGIVRTVNTLTADSFSEGHYEEVVDEETGEIQQKYIDGDMVLCRCSAPLVSMCIKLIAAGKTAHVLGKDIVESLNTMVKKSEAKTIKGFKSWVDTEKERLALEIAKDKDCSKEEARLCAPYITFMDKVNCILAFSHRESNLEYILKELNAIFTKERQKGAITFCTCHKSKGLENYRVFILAPERLPMEWKDQQDWEYEQEMNLKYVAITRAKHELVWVNIEQSRLYDLDFNDK